MANRFHLAIPAGDIDVAIKFYCGLLGCKRGNAEFKYPDAWADIDFWGNELTLHATDPNKKNASERHNVDMGNVSDPHFGVHLDAEVFKNLKERLIQRDVEFIDPPHIRFKDEHKEQETMFIEDPNGNCLEIKTMKNPDTLFESEMIPFLEKVKAKISTETDAEQVLLIDKSSLHSKHESFDSSKFYLRLIITSEKLKKMEKVNAHKVIFSILKDEMKSRIHALEIEIK